LSLNRRDQNHLASQAQEARQRLEQKKQQQSSLQAQLLKWGEERVGLDAELARLAGSLEDQTRQIAGLEEALTTGRAQRQQMGTQLDELKAEMVEILSGKAQAHNAVLAARRQLQELSRRAERRQQEAAELAPKLAAGNQEILDLESQIQHLQGHFKSLKDKQARLRTETQEVRTGLRDMHQEWQRRDNRYRKDQSRLEALQELETRYEWYGQDVRKLLIGQRPAGSPKSSAEVLARLIEVNPSSLQAAEAVFGDLLEALVADSFDDLRLLIQELKQQQGARVHFLPLPFWQLSGSSGAFTTPPGNGHRPLIDEIGAADRVRPFLQSMLSRVFLVEDWSSALDHWVDSPFTYTFVTLDGDCLFADGRVLARSPAAGQSLLHKRQELAELERHCTELRALRATQEELVNAARKRQEALEQGLSTIEQEISTEDAALRQAEQSCLRHQNDRQKWLNKIELLTAENQRDEEDQRFHRETLELNEQQLERFNRAEGELQVQLRDLDERLATLRANLETSEKTYLQGRITLSQDQQRQQQCQQEHKRIEGLISDADRRLTDGLGQIQQAEHDIHQRQNGQIELHEQQQHLDQELRDHRQQLQQQAERQSGLKHRQAELEGRRDALKRVYRVRQHNEQQWQTELTEVTLQIDFLRRRIQEHHRVQLETWQSDGELELIAAEELSRQLEDARARLDKLGEARYGAIEEYDEQKHRQEFLEAQREDLEKTIQGLQNTIQQIQKTSRKRFLETLTAVDTRLAEVFPVLLGGGSARLQLLDEEHPLESGVELLVKLPGKRTSAMSLLSGGEKALTALALLFAISMTKPSPFLLLDEVDAPLDDVNVGRFCDLVQTLQQRSQVIIISHNQRTMEIAQHLIGITMDEPGVSRVIPLDLARHGEG
jgi:chromosome segregation protein